MRAELKRRALVRAEDAFFAFEEDDESENDEVSNDAENPMHRADESKHERGASTVTPPTEDEESAPPGLRGTVARRRRLRKRLEHRFYCCAAAPRAVLLGSIMSVGYVVCAVSRAAVSILAQRCFDDSIFEPRGQDRGVNADPVVRGAVAYVAAAPGLAIGAGAAFTSFASLLRGFAAEDLANFRIAFLLGFAALYVDLPAFVATVHGTQRHDLFNFNLNACVDDYMMKDGQEVYGYPSHERARQLCLAVKCDLWGTALHVVGVFLMTVSAARTFSYNDRSLAGVVEPQPGSPEKVRPVHLLHAADQCTFEYDVRADPRTAPASPRPSGSDDKVRWSAVIVRPRHSQLHGRRSQRRQTWGPTDNPIRQPFS